MKLSYRWLSELVDLEGRTPEEVAHAILFLIKNEFVTGTTVDVDGGALLP